MSQIEGPAADKAAADAMLMLAPAEDVLLTPRTVKLINEPLSETTSSVKRQLRATIDAYYGSPRGSPLVPLVTRMTPSRSAAAAAQFEFSPQMPTFVIKPARPEDMVLLPLVPLSPQQPGQQPGQPPGQQPGRPQQAMPLVHGFPAAAGGLAVDPALAYGEWPLDAPLGASLGAPLEPGASREDILARYDDPAHPSILQLPEDVLTGGAALAADPHLYTYDLTLGDFHRLLASQHAISGLGKTNPAALMAAKDNDFFAPMTPKNNLLRAVYDNYLALLPCQPPTGGQASWYGERMRGSLVLVRIDMAGTGRIRAAGESGPVVEHTAPEHQCVALGVFVGDTLLSNVVGDARFAPFRDDFDAGVDANPLFAPVHIVTTLTGHTLEAFVPPDAVPFGADPSLVAGVAALLAGCPTPSWVPDAFGIAVASLKSSLATPGTADGVVARAFLAMCRAASARRGGSVKPEQTRLANMAALVGALEAPDGDDAARATMAPNQLGLMWASKRRKRYDPAPMFVEAAKRLKMTL